MGTLCCQQEVQIGEGPVVAAAGLSPDKRMLVVQRSPLHLQCLLLPSANMFLQASLSTPASSSSFTPCQTDSTIQSCIPNLSQATLPTCCSLRLCDEPQLGRRECSARKQPWGSFTRCSTSGCSSLAMPFGTAREHVCLLIEKSSRVASIQAAGVLRLDHNLMLFLLLHAVCLFACFQPEHQSCSI